MQSGSDRRDFSRFEITIYDTKVENEDNNMASSFWEKRK